MHTEQTNLNKVSHWLLSNRGLFNWLCLLTMLVLSFGSLQVLAQSDNSAAESETEAEAETISETVLFTGQSVGGMQLAAAPTVSTRFERVASNLILAANFSVWEDGVTYQTSVLADGTLAVEVDMPVLDEESLANSLSQAKSKYLTPEEQAALDEETDWYTLFLFDFQARHLASYDAMTVHVSNPNPHALSINLVVETAEALAGEASATASQAVVQPPYLWLSAEGQATFEVVAMEGNRFEIPAGFSGQLYLPFASFGAEGSNPFQWSDTMGLSAHFPSESGQQQFVIGDIELLRHSLHDLQDLLQTPSFTGNFNLLLPKAGALLEVYEASADTQATGRPYSFSLAENYQGVTVSPEGYLELEAAKLDVDQISLKISDEASGTFSRQVIQLTPLTELNPALADISVPLTSEVAEFETPANDSWYQHLPVIRLVLGLVAFALLGLFVYWWETERRYRQENHRQLKAKRGDN